MDVYEKYRLLTEKLIASGLTAATAESCTSGTVASLITDTPGASAVLKGAFTVYCNEAKELIGVDAGVINTFGVYSEETARELARVCRGFYGSDIGIGVTGTFSETDTANPDSVPGKVHFAISIKDSVYSYTESGISGDTRRQMKLTVAEMIADRLLILLDK